jgi:CHAD domain-containing protein
MLLHLNFCIEWFDSNSKEDSKSFENTLKYLKRKKKKSFILSLAFRPVKPSSPLAQLQPTIAAVACSRARGPSPRVVVPASPPWAKPD